MALDLTNATVSLDYTYVQSKYSCVRDFYFVHIVLNYIIFIDGIACFLVRVIPAVKWTHAFLGRVYISAMILSTASALLIHNEGLPLGVLLAFINVLTAMILAWFLIKIHMNQMEDGAMAMVQQWMKDGKLEGTIRAAVGVAKGHIAMAKTAKERILSYKSLHGILMTISWFNVAGRIPFAPLQGFTCYTYPAYKAINTDTYKTAGIDMESKSLTQRLLPLESEKPPFWTGWEGGWFAFSFFFPVTLALLIGLCCSCWAEKRERAMLKPTDIVIALSKTNLDESAGIGG